MGEEPPPGYRTVPSPIAPRGCATRSLVPFGFHGNLLGFGFRRFGNTQRKDALVAGRLNFVRINVAGKGHRTAHLAHVALAPQVSSLLCFGFFLT